MENKEVLLIFINALQLFLGSAVGETTVQVTTPITPVIVGGILAVQCQVWNIQNGDTVTISRTSDEVSEQISSGDSIVKSSVKDRVYLSIRTFPDGSSVYFLTMLDVSLEDSGEYACSVIKFAGSLPTVLDHGSVDVEVYSFPDKSQPSCTGNPPNLMLKEETTLELTCTAYKTAPVVELKWRSLSTYEYLQSSSLSETDTIVSRFYIRTSVDHHGAVFRCEMTSPGFPDRIRSCEIGPISVESSSKTVNHDLSPTTRTPHEDILLDATNSIGDCQNICTTSSKTVFYLTVSTAAACLLTVVFFITTLVMCCKYDNVSSDVRQRQQYVPSPPSLESDPVYVSLQRRNTNERVYMTLEDPNNPEGKVLLPKEVFDEFYNRTFTLRKT